MQESVFLILDVMSKRLTVRDWDYIPKLQIFDGEVDNGGVLLHKEVVLGEALDVQNQVGRQLGEAESSPACLDVVAGLLVVELPQQVKDGHLHQIVSIEASSLFGDSLPHATGASAACISWCHCWFHAFKSPSGDPTQQAPMSICIDSRHLMNAVM